MVTRIQKWGNSQGLRITRELLSDARIEVGDEVEVAVNNGVITISPTIKQRKRLDLNELLAGHPKDLKAEELDWGKPFGKEVW